VLILLTLGVAMTLSAIPIGTEAATAQDVTTQAKHPLVRAELEPARAVVPDPPTPLKLVPDEATVTVGIEQPYKAIRVDELGNEEDITASTEFTITGPGPGTCTEDGDKASCKASEPGTYTVKGTLETLPEAS